MNIANRLKEYLVRKQIPVTQFADTCDIPRPSMSQLLNGRNKKVSDELIRKIHASYPDLSVLWLMFGEGPMIQLQPSQASPSQSPSQPPSPPTEQMSPSIYFDEGPISGDSDKATDTTSDDDGEQYLVFDDDSATQPDDTQSINQPVAEETSPHEVAATQAGKISFSTDPTKHIVNIIVYYSDNSYESFGPK